MAPLQGTPSSINPRFEMTSSGVEFSASGDIRFSLIPFFKK